MPEAGPFGRYRLDRLLGRGGMGEVWRAYDAQTRREVALKVLPAHYAKDTEFRRRFELEAELAAALSDPHIVPIHGYGEIDGHLYIDMALVEGTGLDAILRNGPLPPEDAVAIVEQVAAALDSAHAKSLIHRDIKPSNVFVHHTGFAYLIDFGIARREGDASLTDTAVTIGSLGYMAPERFDGQLSSRVDVYGLACVLYECLTATPPFGRVATHQLIAAHLRTPPPTTRDHPAAIPSALDDVVAWGMAKDPAQRPATAGELARAARAALTKQPVPHDPRRRSALPLVAGGVIVAAAVVAGVVLWPKDEASGAAPEPGTTQADPPPVDARLGASIPVGDQPISIALDARTGRLYVANDADGTVSVVDSASFDEIAVIPVGARPQSIALDGDHTAYVANVGDGTVSVIDTRTNTVDGPPIAAGAAPVSVELDSAATTLYVADQLGSAVTTIDVATRTITGTIPVGDRPVWITAVPGSGALYVVSEATNSVTMIDAQSHAAGPSIGVGAFPGPTAADATTGRVYVANTDGDSVSVIDGDAVVDTIPVCTRPLGIAIDPDRGLAFVTCDASLATIDLADGSTRADIRTPALSDSVLDRESNRLFAVDVNADAVRVVELAG